MRAVVDAVSGRLDPSAVPVANLRRYELGAVEGVGLAVTDAVALPDGRLLLSAAAEDTPNAVDDGLVVGTALVLMRDDDLLALAALPAPGGTVHKVEGLALLGTGPHGVRLLTVVEADDPDVPSAQLTGPRFLGRWHRPRPVRVAGRGTSNGGGVRGSVQDRGRRGGRGCARRRVWRGR
jgi:hypothetical protein